MSDFILALSSFPLLIFLITLRVPIGLALLAVGIFGNFLVNGSFLPILSLLKTIPYETFSNYSLSVIPLFLLMGQFVSYSGISKSLFEATEAWFGAFKGGLAIATIVACAGFGAICGSSLATTSTMGKVVIPHLKRAGYSASLITGSVSAGGTLGVLIPPSIVLIIYAILTEQNLAKLFVAAFIPGVLSVLGYIVVVSIYIRLVPEAIFPTTHFIETSFKKKINTLLKNGVVLGLFGIVVGGIYFGIFTPSEGAGVGVFITFLIGLKRKAFSFKKIKKALLDTATTTAMIYLIILGTSVFNSFLAFANFPQEIADWVTEGNFSPYTILLIILLFYIILGCFMDSLSMLLLTIPLFYPLVAGLDFGLTPEEFGIWFGIITLVVVEIGLITPPIGMNLFVIRSLTNTPLAKTYRGVIPFLISDFIRIILLVLFPAISLIFIR